MDVSAHQLIKFQTFKSFLKSREQRDLHEKCKPFLMQSKGLPLYRGYGGKISSVLKGTREVPIRKDRRPRDSSQFVHDLLDAYFQKKFGAKARSEGLFATGYKAFASNYGHPYYVLPVGNFKFIWGEYGSEPVRDTVWWSNQIKDMMQTRSKNDADVVTADVLNKITWHSDDLPGAIRSGAEIVILADSAIIIPVSKTPYSEIIGQ